MEMAEHQEERASAVRERIDEYLAACFANESAPRVTELARHLGLSRNRLDRIARDALGVPPSSYLKRRQLEEAQRLLATTTLSAQRIGYRTGFGTRRTFFRAFHAIIDLTPTQFRFRVRKA
ncbi:MAG: helix-turn-helix domain-containing protein [Thermoanaerobaculia bacterium]